MQTAQLIDSAWFPSRAKAEKFAREKRKAGYLTEIKRPGFHRKSGWSVNVYHEGVQANENHEAHP